MSDDNRRHHERLPEFYLPDAVDGHRIHPDVRVLAERLWPWAWNYIGSHLADHAGAAQVAEIVACRVSRYLEANRDDVRSLVAVYYTATANSVRTIRSRDGRIDYRGLAQDLELFSTAQAPDWREESELWILAEEIGQHFDPVIREMFHMRLLRQGWGEIAELHGLTADQARLRFRRAVNKLPEEILQFLKSLMRKRDTRPPQQPPEGPEGGRE